ncbi:MAG: N-succinylarginine dihydrolase, partial [Hyphomonadaceae bacterium]
ALGFSGSDDGVWANVWKVDERIARAAIAASSMWAANAATVSPSADCADRRIHFTPANLLTMLHRAEEAEQTGRALARAFPAAEFFVHHGPLFSHDLFADEGAANHMRLSAGPGEPGLEIFVYGRTGDDPPRGGFPGRQTLESCQAIARAHGLDPARTIFIRQARRAIDAGAFHNDVVAVAHQTTLFFHEHAFEEKAGALAEIKTKAKGLFEPIFVETPASAVSLDDAVSSYLFNSQLLRTPGAQKLTLIAPNEVRENNKAGAYVSDLISRGGPIGAVEYVEVRESMRNGGGPACLRLRVELTDEQRAAAQGCLLSEAKVAALEAWVRKHYREELGPADLPDPALIGETQTALDELTRILPLGGDFYAFQRG